MLKKLLEICTRSKNVFFLIIASSLIFFLLRVLPFYSQIADAFALPNMTWALKADVLTEYVFSTFSFAPLSEQILQILLSIFTALNVLLLVVFAKKQQKFLKKKSFWGGISGMALGMFGVGCVSCGVFVLAPIITFLGFGAYLNFFASHAVQISFVGLLLVIISCAFVLKKIASPQVCKI